ncbi:MAG: Re/Si-specific NAD(P)(+) transhydrogenase subunit alpha [Acidobacteria bacterium]|nr:Re/Si-specific NAD(P)(+) transhydrogenase subunit alpha [Acidobacteriota bacterium]
MIVGVPIETYPAERRVALVPLVAADLAKAGLEVVVQPGAGEKAGFPDAAYQKVKARLVSDRTQLFSLADVILQVNFLDAHPGAGDDLELLRQGQIVLGLLNPFGAPQTAQKLAQRGVTAFALELLPRIGRAQPMDALTSMATIAGYKAVLVAAVELNKMYPLMMTAAGTIRPSRVFVIGAGVAGLQAIATAHRLGALVQAYDVRPAVKEQVESLGAKFVELELNTEGSEGSGGYAEAMDEEFYRRQREMMARVVAKSDVVITTAAVAGRKAPMLITEEAVQGMHPGSVIVDLAAEGGGNCELTRPGERVEYNGVTILGPTDLPSTVAHHASQMYAKNVSAFLHNLVKEGQLDLNLEDEIIRDTLLTHQGEVINPQVRELLAQPTSAPVNDERKNS